MINKTRSIIINIQEDMRIIKIKRRVFYDNLPWGFNGSGAEKKLFDDSLKTLKQIKNNFDLLFSIYAEAKLIMLKNISKDCGRWTQNMIKHNKIYKEDWEFDMVEKRMEILIDRTRMPL